MQSPLLHGRRLLAALQRHAFWGQQPTSVFCQMNMSTADDSEERPREQKEPSSRDATRSRQQGSHAWQPTDLYSMTLQQLQGQAALVLYSKVPRSLRFCTRADVARLLHVQQQDVSIDWSLSLTHPHPAAFHVLYSNKADRDNAVQGCQKRSATGQLKLGSHDVSVETATLREVAQARSSYMARIVSLTDRLQGGLQGQEKAQDNSKVPPGHTAVLTTAKPVTKDQLLQAYGPLDLVPPYAVPIETERGQANDTAHGQYVLFFGSEAGASRAACDRQARLALGADVGQVTIHPFF